MTALPHERRDMRTQQLLTGRVLAVRCHAPSSATSAFASSSSSSSSSSSISSISYASTANTNSDAATTTATKTHVLRHEANGHLSLGFHRSRRRFLVVSDGTSAHTQELRTCIREGHFKRRGDIVVVIIIV